MEHYRITESGSVSDREADENYLDWADDQRARGRYVVDGVDLGELSPGQLQRHGVVVLVMRDAKQNLKRAAGRVGGLFTPG